MDPVKQVGNLSVSPQDYRYKCPYLTVLIIDLVQTIILGIAILILLFVTGFMMDLIGDSDKNFVTVLGSSDSNGTVLVEFSLNVTTGDQTGQKKVELPTGAIWIIRVCLLIILTILITIQYFGWKGYKKHHFTSVIVFAVFKGMAAISALGKLCAAFTLSALVGLSIHLLAAVIPVMFAMEIRKRKIYGVTTAQP